MITHAARATRAGLLAVTALLVLASTTNPTAQLADRDQHSGIIIGAVVDARTGDRVPGVRVTRWLVNANDLTQYEVITDARGRFLYHDVAAGQWRIVAELGSRRGSFGRRRPHGPDRLVAIADGGVVADVTIRLFDAGGVISGRVTDDLGEPVVGTLVGALHEHPWFEGPDGEPVLTRYWQITRTDDRGLYRLSVEPGRYVIHVPAAPVVSAHVDSAGGLESPAGPVLSLGRFLIRVVDPERPDDPVRPTSAPERDARGGLLVYRSAIGLAAAGAGNGRPFEVSGGDEHTDVDVRLTLARAVRVSGRLVGPGGPLAGARVDLVATTIDGIPLAADQPIAAAVSDGGGGFVLFGVPPGQYKLLVFETNLGRSPVWVDEQPVVVNSRGGSVGAAGTRVTQPPSQEDGATVWAALPVDVGDGDVAGLEVVAAHGTRVSGRLVFETDDDPPIAARVSRAAVSLSGDSRLPENLSRRASPDAVFFTAEFPPGRYLLRATLGGWLVKSAMYLGRDLTLEPFALGADPLEGVVVTMTDRVAAVAGRVRGNAATAATDASVLIFRADYQRRRRFAARVGTYKAVRVSDDGSFLATGLLAGDYLVAAVDDAQVLDWPGTRMLDRLAPVATAVTLAEGRTASVDLDVRIGR